MNTSFLYQLRSKLLAGNRNSALLQALPTANTNRLDLYKIESLFIDKGQTILNHLTQGTKIRHKINLSFPEKQFKTSEQIQTALELKKQLDNLSFQQKMDEEEQGFHTMELAFPMLFFRNPKQNEQVIAAPIFLQSVQIEKVENSWDEWLLTSSTEKARINEVLVYFLEDTFGISEDKKVEWKQLLKVDSVTAFVQILEEIWTHFGLELEQIPAQILVSSPLKNIVQGVKVKRPIVRWSTVLGSFSMPNKEILQDIDAFIKLNDEQSVSIPNKYHFAPISTDPFQKSVLKALENQDEILVHGPPGTGKSKTLTALIANQLLNQKTCLVISEKVTALNVIQQNLAKIGLEDLSIIITDKNKDRQKVAKKARRISEELKDQSSNFDVISTKFIEREAELNSVWNDLDCPILGKYYLSDLIGFLLQNPSLKTFNEIDFEFNNKEFQQLENLYQTIKEKGFNSLNVFHPFLNIHKEIKEKLILSAQEELKNRIGIHQDFKQKSFERLKAQFITFNHDFEVKKELFQNELEQKVTELQQLISEIQSISKEDFTIQINQLWFEKIKGFFSPIKNKLLQKRVELERKITDFDVFLTENDCFVSKLFVFGKTIDSFLKQLETINSKEKINPNPYFLQQIGSEFIKEIQPITELPILEIESLENEYILSQFLIDFLENDFETIKKDEEQFLNYYQFLQFQHKLDKQQSKQAQFLLTIDWKEFQAFYFKQFLLNQSFENFPTDDLKLKSCSIEKEQLNQEVLNEIKSNYTKELQSEIEKLRAKNQPLKRIFNLKGNKGESRNSLHFIFNKYLNITQKIFPVILMNPKTAAALLPVEKGLFDMILFDESSQLKLEHTFTLLERGKTKVIAGDEHQMPPKGWFSKHYESVKQHEDFDLGLSDSLLEYAMLKGYSEHFLNIHYRSKSPELIQFINQEIYNNRLLVLAQNFSEKAVLLHQIDGIYDKKLAINRREAIEIVKHIVENAQNYIEKTFSIGIITMNLAQRNFIVELLYQEFSETKNQFLSKILETILIRNLDRIQGEERDVIYISTTYAPTEDGKFNERFGFINTKEGYKLINVLMTRAKQKLNIFTSIPQEKYVLPQEKPLTGKGLLYSYLNQVSNKKNTQIEQNYVLKTENFLANHIADIIKKSTKHKVVFNYELCKAVFDMAILDEQNQPIYFLLIDGIKNIKSKEYFDWENYYQFIATQNNIPIHRIWSLTWWLSAETEANRLLASLEFKFYGINN